MKIDTQTAAADLWTAENSRAATEQGWDLFHIDGAGLRSAVQKHDESDRFANDLAAIVFVRKQARWGCLLAIKAMRMDEVLRKELPEDPDAVAIERLANALRRHWNPRAQQYFVLSDRVGVRQSDHSFSWVADDPVYGYRELAPTLTDQGALVVRFGEPVPLARPRPEPRTQARRAPVAGDVIAA
ncbi:hypothetical protein [Paraburkholderia sp. J8-2]|uniref:hypothetical protein n=1 Tax=Paraburkholderia sp. J8-2 TaxID=2805440 RepID=UPI002AB715F1|nr:hypothetical protein [Paraburkholderia sp. J8-2]